MFTVATTELVSVERSPLGSSSFTVVVRVTNKGATPIYNNYCGLRVEENDAPGHWATAWFAPCLAVLHADPYAHLLEVPPYEERLLTMSVGYNAWRSMPPTPGVLYRVRLSLVTRGPYMVHAEMGTTLSFQFPDQ